ncbi:MAG: DUF1573 domain-containing protein [Desulfobacterales bacterium]|nr:DUF1573 domain-containing protein [Desulfobacterales bacterium]
MKKEPDMIRVRRAFGTFSALLPVFILCTALATSQALAGPRAAVENRKHDFGSVYAGSDVIHAFVIENTGDAPLIIKSVRTG